MALYLTDNAISLGPLFSDARWPWLVFVDLDGISCWW